MPKLGHQTVINALNKGEIVNRSFHLGEGHSEAYNPKIGKYQQNLRNSQYFYLILLQENGLFPPRKGVNSPIKRGNFHQENGLGTMHINKFFVLRPVWWIGAICEGSI